MSGRLSAREKMLAWSVGGVVAAFASFGLASYFWHTNATLAEELATRQGQLKALQQLLIDRALWDQRDAWLTAHQPRMENQDTAAYQLLDQVKDAAKRHTVTLEQPSMGRVENKADYSEVTVSVDARAAWKDLVAFMQELQGPEKFVVFESANLQVDPQDQTRMLGKFRIARWFAPVVAARK